MLGLRLKLGLLSLALSYPAYLGVTLKSASDFLISILVLSLKASSFVLLMACGSKSRAKTTNAERLS